MPTILIGRREFIAGAATSLLTTRGALAARPGLEVYRDPACGCCGGWVEHMKNAGYAVTVMNAADLEATKRGLGVPEALWSCHTALLGTYVIEGHVPAPAVGRLLTEKPAIRGLAVPGMPSGSPGMEGGPLETYDIVAFGEDRRYVFGRYRGALAM